MNVSTERKRINTRMLVIDPLYQRNLNKQKVNRIVKNFDPLLVNPVKCSFRDGKYYVFDGQHTIAAVRAKNKGKDVDMDCLVYFGLTEADEAHYFIQQTGISSGVSTNEKLRAEFNFGNKDVIGMVMAAETAGVRVDFTQGQATGKCTAVGTLFKCYQAMTRDQFIQMLRVIKSAWDGNFDGYRREILNGMSVFVKTYYGEFTERKLVSSLRNVAPSAIVREGKSIGAHAGSSPVFARIILRCYNKNRTTGRLNDKL